MNESTRLTSNNASTKTIELTKYSPLYPLESSEDLSTHDNSSGEA